MHFAIFGPSRESERNCYGRPLTHDLTEKIAFFSTMAQMKKSYDKHEEDDSQEIRQHYITCTKILVLWLVDSRSLFYLFIESDDKTSYCTPFGSARVQKLFTIALIVYFYIRVFIISNTIFGRLL